MLQILQRPTLGPQVEHNFVVKSFSRNIRCLPHCNYQSAEKYSSASLDSNNAFPNAVRLVDKIGNSDRNC